jgi:hypothetical protein
MLHYGALSELFMGDAGESSERALGMPASDVRCRIVTPSAVEGQPQSRLEQGAP